MGAKRREERRERKNHDISNGLEGTGSRWHRRLTGAAVVLPLAGLALAGVALAPAAGGGEFGAADAGQSEWAATEGR